MEFVFPLEEIKRVESLPEARRIILASLRMENLQPYCSYRFQLVGSKYIYCRCKDCPAKIVFRKSEELYEVFKTSTKHKHKKIRCQRPAILEAIKNCPQCFSTQSIKQMIMARFQISSSTFYRYFRQTKTYGITIEDVLASLRSEGLLTVLIKNQEDLETNLPSILLVSSQEMIAKYHKNSRNVKFDLTYNLIREQTTTLKQYAVGVFTTLSNNMNIEPVGFAIMNEETKESFVKLFHQFFIMMGQSSRIVITDEQITMALALKQLEERQIFLGYHFIDVFHVLRNAKKSLLYKANINYLVSLSRCSSQIEYITKRASYFPHFVGRDRDYLESFHQKMKKCCIGLLPSIFLGLSCSTNSCQKINDIIKTRIPYSQKYLTVVSVLSKMLMNMTNKINTPKIDKVKLENYLAISSIQIQNLRQRLCKNAFQKLIRSLSLSLMCLVSLTDHPNIYSITQQEFGEDQKFTVQFDSLEEPPWDCTCDLTKKTGIPCAHILKIVLLRRQKIITAINPWWLLQQQSVIVQSPGIAFPRKSRRN